MDSWGEGHFPLIGDTTEAELRNPNTQFLGLRGRKRLKGQLPTVLLDNIEKKQGFKLSVKNAVTYSGIRMIEVESKDIGFNLTGLNQMFSGVLKIVEEDFNKR